MVTADSDGPVEVCVPVRHPPEDPAELAWRARARAPGSLHLGNQDHFRDSRDLVDLRPAGALGSRSRPQTRRSTQRGLPARGRTALRGSRPADLRCHHPVRCIPSAGQWPKRSPGTGRPVPGSRRHALSDLPTQPGHDAQTRSRRPIIRRSCDTSQAPERMICPHPRASADRPDRARNRRYGASRARGRDRDRWPIVL